MLPADLDAHAHAAYEVRTECEVCILLLAIL